MTQNNKHKGCKGELQSYSLPILGIIWLLGAVSDRLWFAFDHNVPAWDQAEYLTGTLTYQQALQNPQWFSGAWWTNFWQLSAKMPPLTYIIAALWQNFFGKGSDQATLIHLFFSAILLASVYGLGVQLFNPKVGLWAAGLCVLLPGLYQYRLDFLLDYPLTSVVTFSFFCLTVWQIQSQSENQKNRVSAWLWAIVLGFSLGVALLIKQTALLFLFTPILWVGVGSIRQKAWERFAQLASSLCLSILIAGPWYRTNWLLILTSSKRATVDSAIAEGDPALNTLDAWIYYWKILPNLISWPLLLVPIVGILLYFVKRSGNFRFTISLPHPKAKIKHSFGWLVIFVLGAYFLGSLNINKDPRYITPYLPVISLFLALGLTLWKGRWATYIRWGTIGFATLLMLLNLWPVGGSWLTQIFSHQSQHYAYLGKPWPHEKVINEIIKTEPYLRSNLGVLPSTPGINQHNFNYYGALKDFQVYGRQVGTLKRHVPQDVRSLSWFITKTGDQGSVPQEAQSTITRQIEQNPDFHLQRAWSLPDQSILMLYHQRQPPVQVQPLTQPVNQIQLTKVTVPDRTPPGVPVPITYEWSGAGEQLQSGLVLITWKATFAQSPNSPSRWLHDRGIGMGNLDFTAILHSPAKSPSSFRVIENTAMLPPANITPGIYTLKATYLNRQTGKTYPIAVPPVTLTIDPSATATPAPELDLITQLRILAAKLPQGTKALETVFDQIGRINQYDPTQDYLNQAHQALAYRLQQEPQNLAWVYSLALTNVLQRQVQEAIASFEQVTQLDSQNPYAYAYLAFVNLYDWRPTAAQTALNRALALNPNLPELKALSGVAALMQGNLVKAWTHFQTLAFDKK